MLAILEREYTGRPEPGPRKAHMTASDLDAMAACTWPMSATARSAHSAMEGKGLAVHVRGQSRMRLDPSLEAC